MSVDQAKLMTACRTLVALVDNAQPGLATWHSMCVIEVDRIRAAVGPSEVDARARWAVRVLDRWPHGWRMGAWRYGEGPWHNFCEVGLPDYCEKRFEDSDLSADAARIAAAEAVFPDLPADVRTNLGERP